MARRQDVGGVENMVEPHKNQDFMIEQIYDPMSLHTLTCLGEIRIIPNLKTGKVESIEYQEMAHLIDPPIKCPNCKRIGIISTHLDNPSLVFKTSGGQYSYLCDQCWSHSIIGPFGVWSKI
ncbi:MAG: hypothetical protein NLN64_00010 [Candidatus Thalassarchaeaceae archaeon]|nr:hypothetical protein [Candidatus Thalassarchaeaceae archaeon]